MNNTANTAVNTSSEVQAFSMNPITNKLTVATPDWDFAIDCVTYPVYLKPLHYHHEDEEQAAEGVTNTGRDSKFYGVVVDRNRTEDLSTIAVVTGLYDTISATEVYQALRDDLERDKVDNQPVSVYVSGNGGKQELLVKLDGLTWCNNDHDVQMHLKLTTSVDGTTKHTVRVAAIDMKTNAEIVGIEGMALNLSTRHTKSIRERHAAFGVIIQTLIDQWDDMIIPSMQLMNDCKFDKNLAITIIESMMEEANIPEAHCKQATQYYESLMHKEHNMLGVCSSIGSYFSEELANKPERLAQFQEKLAKKSQKIIKKYLDKV